jgi:DNA-binding CsgD family transcriptional regulator/PAS domain-containing protein
MAHETLDQLIQGVYDAALEPERWDDVAALFRKLFDSPGGGLFMQDARTQAFRPICMFGLPDRYLASYAEYYAQTNAWALAGLQRPGWTITDESVDRAYNTPGAFAESEFCNDWLKPQGYSYGMGGTVKAIGTEYFHYTILRPPDAPRFGDTDVHNFDLLKPHLGRAIEVSTRLRGLEQQITSHSDIFDRLPIAALLLDDHGQVRHANRKAAEITQAGRLVRIKQGQLVSEFSYANAPLQRVLNEALAFCRGGTSSGPFSTTVSARARPDRLSVVIVPLSRRKPLFSDLSLALAVFLHESTTPIPLDRNRLQRRYGLSRSEARLAAQLSCGQELKTAARSVGISYETARGYLKAIFRKTETNSQTELLARMLSDPTLVLGSERST